MKFFSIVRWTALVTMLSLAACVSIPPDIDGEYSTAFQPAQVTERSVGARVRWGGLVIETRPEQQRTCIEILAQPLDSGARPERSDQDLGRFVACRAQFYDPEIFVNGREVTVVGRLQGFSDGQIGEFEYRYPQVEADSVYLWPAQVDLPSSYYYPWPGYFYPWPYYGRPYYYGPYRSYGGYGSRHGVHGQIRASGSVSVNSNKR